MRSLSASIILLLLLGFLPPAPALASTTDGTIDASNRYAWSENAGWIDFGTTEGNVHITDSALTGYAWGENVGWISLNCSNDSSCGTVDYKVTNNNEGALGGHAWSENLGWIQFAPTNGGVTIDSSGVFSGYAWGENIGWIVFNCSNQSSCATADFKVSTDYRPTSARTSSSSSSSLAEQTTGGGGHGGRRGSEEGMAEKIAAAQEQILAKRGLTSPASPPSSPSVFRDVPSTSWFSSHVQELATAGILRGYSSPNGTPTGLFGPADPVTYAEITAIAFRVLREDHETSALVPKNRSARGTWASGIIEAAEERGVPVLTTALNVHTPATRAEVIAILLHLLPLASSSGENPYTDLPADHPYRDILLQATSLGILQGDTSPDGTLLHTLRPDDPINRAEAAKIISLLLELRQQ